MTRMKKPFYFGELEEEEEEVEEKEEEDARKNKVEGF